MRAESLVKQLAAGVLCLTSRENIARKTQMYVIFVGIMALCLLPQTLFAQGTDLEAPELQSVEFTPLNIDVTAASGNVTLIVRITDNLSGFKGGSFILESSSRTKEKIFTINAGHRTSGDALDGIYEKTLTFEEFSEPGTWTLEIAQLSDETTNTRRYLVAELQGLGFDKTIEVTSFVDSQAPALQSLTFSTPIIDVNNGPNTVTLDVGITDNLSGFYFANVWFFAPIGSGGSFRGGIFGVNQLVPGSGDALAGIYRTTVLFPEFIVPGEYRLQFQFSDRANNRETFTIADIQALNLPATITVLSDPVDAEPPVLVAFDFSPKVINTVLSDDTTTANVNITDDAAGFNFGIINFVSPSGNQVRQLRIGFNDLISGDIRNGYYESDATFPRFSEFGKWRITGFRIDDRVSHGTGFMSQQTLIDLGFPTELLIEGVIANGSGVFTVFPEGGTIQTDDGILEMEFGNGSLSEETDITITRVGRFDPVDIIVGTNPNSLIGNVIAEYNFEPDGLIFAEGSPVTVTMTIDVTALNSTQRSKLDIYTFDEAADLFVEVPDADIISIVKTPPDSSGNEFMVFTFSLAHFSTYAVIENISDVGDDSTAPEVAVTVPQDGDSVQDNVTLIVKVTDESSIASVKLSIREADGGTGVIGAFEEVSATARTGTDFWDLNFDSTQLLDGRYIIIAKAVDEHGNEGTSTPAVNFSIRNWAVMRFLPASNEFKAGRTVPIKISVRVSINIDPSAPFVHNEKLEFRIYETSNPGNVLQLSRFGDKSTDYRINSATELYITNFKTSKKQTQYTVDILRITNDFLIGSFDFVTTRK